MDFSDNLAKSYGGAIYVKSDADCSLNATCSISVYGEKGLVMFNNNSAEVGPVMYGGTLDKWHHKWRRMYVSIPGFCSCW